ncbi:unnamed protein product, partial [Mycena citricolor]
MTVTPCPPTIIAPSTSPRLPGHTRSSARNMRNSAARLASGCRCVAASSAFRCAGATSVASRFCVLASSAGSTTRGALGTNADTTDTNVVDADAAWPSSEESESKSMLTVGEALEAERPSNTFAGSESNTTRRNSMYPASAAGSIALYRGGVNAVRFATTCTRSSIESASMAGGPGAANELYGMCEERCVRPVSGSRFGSSGIIRMFAMKAWNDSVDVSESDGRVKNGAVTSVSIRGSETDVLASTG